MRFANLGRLALCTGLGVALLALPAWGATLRFVDASGQGVECAVRKITGNGQEIPLGDTDEQGIIEYQQCEQRELLVAMPYDSVHFEWNSPCPLQETQIVMEGQGEWLEEAPPPAAAPGARGGGGQPGPKPVIYRTSVPRRTRTFLKRRHSPRRLPALVLNDFYAQTRRKKGRRAERYRISTIRRAAKSLGVRRSLVFDRAQKRWVVSPELTWALHSFQRQKGIPATGKLDYRTLRALAGRPLKYYLRWKRVIRRR